MTCLCYCIHPAAGPEPVPPLVGVGGSPVYQVAHKGLRAAVSRVKREELAPDLDRVRTFEQVVLFCYRKSTVIPMRYGCALEEDSKVIEHLDRHGTHYEALLEELEGCVEMGLRVLLPSGPWAGVTPGGLAGSREFTGPPPDPKAPPEHPGLAYLTARKAHYAHQDRWTNDYHLAAERCRDRFAGLFVKCKTEAPSFKLPLLSLYFLVPQAAVSSFRQAFRQLSASESARLLLSGPWPPYNFVTASPQALLTS
jgi:hypothetical protein